MRMSETRVTRRSAEKEPPTLELVLKRNSVERIKREKDPLGMLGELPALIAAGYEQVPEEDLVRLKWWGLYHDKPKIGTFMLRIKLPAAGSRPRSCRPSASSRCSTARARASSRRGRRFSSTTSSSPRCRRCSAGWTRSG